VLGSELPVLNREAFERTAAFLSSEAVISYLEILAERGEALRHALHDPNSVTHAGIHLAAAAHTLAGSAGMFGFERLAAVARRFERAVQTGAPEAQAIAHDLVAVVEASLREMRSGRHVAAEA
jgi:HPt (histidine-containing phosphotransfer) domain-containing protein